MLHTERTTEKIKPGLRDYWQIFLRRKWLIILPIVTIVSIAIPGSFLMTPTYQATTILISQEVQRGSILQGVTDIPVPRGEEMSTIRQKIESRRYMKEVADKIGIAEYLRSIGKPATTDDVVRYLRGIITLRSRGGNIIEISAIHPNPDTAKNLADTIANTYVENTMRWRQDTVTDTTSFINQELETYRQRLREAEEAFVAAQEKGVFDSLSGEDNALVIEVAKLKANLVEAELDLQEANSEFQNARRLVGSSVTESYSSPFYTDPEVIRLQTKLAGLQAQYTQLSIRYTDQYPEVIKLKGEIIQTQEELDQAKGKFSTRQQDVAARMKYWEDRVRSLGLKRTALDDKISEYDRKLQQLPQRQLELARLSREKAAAENTFSMLLSRLNESELLRASELQRMGRVAEILDPAIAPDRPVKPNKKKIAVLALAMGVIIGGGSAFLLEYFDRSFRTVDEVTNYLGIPVLAAIPRLTTYESDLKDRKRRRVMIVSIASVSLLVLILVADIVSAEFLARNSIFLNIVQSGIDLARRLM